MDVNSFRSLCGFDTDKGKHQNTGFQKMIGSLVKAGEQMTCESVERDNNDVRGGL